MSAPSFKLTKRAVDNASPRLVRYILWDSELKGFALRIAQSGTKTYIVRYRPRGIGPGAPKRFVVIGRHGPVTPEEARSRAKALLGAAASGRDPAMEQTRPVETITVACLIEVFIEEHVRAKRKTGTAAGYAYALRNYLLPRFGKRPADGLTPSEIGQLHFSMRDRPYQANRVLAVTASMYAFAGKRGLVSKGTNPVTGIERYRESSRERYLSSDELNRLGETLRLAETTGLPWQFESAKPTSKHPARSGEPSHRARP